MDREAKLARLLEHPAIWRGRSAAHPQGLPSGFAALDAYLPGHGWPRTGLIEILVSRFRSEEHTSELQSQSNLVCRLLLEKKKKILCKMPTFPSHSTLTRFCSHCDITVVRLLTHLALT